MYGDGEGRGTGIKGREAEGGRRRERERKGKGKESEGDGRRREGRNGKAARLKTAPAKLRGQDKIIRIACPSLKPERCNLHRQKFHPPQATFSVRTFALGTPSNTSRRTGFGAQNRLPCA